MFKSGNPGKENGEMQRLSGGQAQIFYPLKPSRGSSKHQEGPPGLGKENKSLISQFYPRS
jgi:hypothetical protein